jgi:hypothetical protein
MSIFAIWSCLRPFFRMPVEDGVGKLQADFARQTHLLAIKFNYPHCPISMRVVVIYF